MSAAATPQFIDLDGKPVSLPPVTQAPPGNQPKTPPQYIDLGGAPIDFTKNVPLQAPFVGRAAVGMLPVAGASLSEAFSGEPALGALAGTATKDFLRSFPQLQSLIGQNPQSGWGLVGDAAGDQLTNVVLPNVVRGIAGASIPGVIANTPLKNLPAVRSGVAATISQQLMDRMNPGAESGILEGAARQAQGTQLNLVNNILDARKNLQQSVQTLSPGIPDQMAAYKGTLQDLENTFGKNQVGGALLKLQQEMDEGADVAKSQTYRQIATTTLSDLSHVRNFKLATGSPEAVEGLALNRLLTNGFKSYDGTIDAGKTIAELTGKNSEIYGEALRPETMQNLKDLLGGIKDQQMGHEVSDRLIHYAQGHLIWTGLPLATGTLTGHAGVGTLVSAAAASPIITNSMLSRLMANPETAKMVTQALRTSNISPEGDLLEMGLRGAMRSLTNVVTTPSGDRQTPQH